jgi:hypothetical protein
MSTKQASKEVRIVAHGNKLLKLFPNATEKDPGALCRKLRRLEAKAAALALRGCNGPEWDSEEAEESAYNAVLTNVNKLLGNVREYQPKKGGKCSCRPGQQRDNCPACEGTGMLIDFAAIRNAKPLVPVFINRDPRGYQLKIKDDWMTANNADLERDWGGYGLLAPEIK